MSPVFADTFYFLAYLNPMDEHHFEQAGFQALLKP